MFQLDGRLATSATFHLYTNAHWMFALMVLVLESITIQLPAVSVFCFVANPSSTYFLVAGEPAYDGVYGFV